MKLVIGIVSNDDASTVLSQINSAHFTATKLSTSGGFLRAGNVTLLVGVEEDNVPQVIEIFKSCCSKRTQFTPTVPPFVGEGYISSAPIEVTVGGATVFVLDVDAFYKL